ncbi:MAG TPA: hypothetical protein VH120_10135 [Gemmataceae bacterium]|jgi:hypothetical protein|nr:hypothetical protein [Gemmataceae bacterium]
MAEELDIPSWVKGRQAKVEPVGEGAYRVTGPNLPEAVVGVRMTDDLAWQGFLKDMADGPDVAVATTTQDNARDALYAAFELYRERLIY